jgi:hypothetical protein
MDTSRAAVKVAVTAAVLALAIEGAGLDSEPVVILASVVPFLVGIERVELTPGGQLAVAALLTATGTWRPSRAAHPARIP